MSDMEIVKEFLVESYENLDRLDQDLVALEKDPGNKETLSSVFRTIHTIKGTSGFLAFNQLEAVTHVGESLLSKLRDGLLKLTPEITTTLLAMVDAVRQMLASIESIGSEGQRDDDKLVTKLTRLLQSPEEGKQDRSQATGNGSRQEKATQSVLNIVEVQSNGPKSSDAVEQHAAAALPALPPESPEKDEGRAADIHEGANAPLSAGGPSASDSTIRVNVEQLDRLMNRVGELVLLRNQIVQYTNSLEDSELQGPGQRLNLLTTELQEGVMKTRMQPIGNVWNKFPRTVRDVAVGCGKQVRIEMEGSDTELDKTIIEAIKDPLTHLVRNAVDHGIETPEARRAAAKEPEGCLVLRAFHEGGQVNIEISDDGAGLDIEKIRRKAIDNALINASQAARMSEREITNLIFLPGFSTAEKVTSISGRGVGMDVVRTNIERIGGTVDVQSKLGYGTTVRMKIPLTLAIIPALIVTNGGDRYAIPQVSLLELVRLEGEQGRKGIERVQGAPVYRLRGRLLPLVYLDKELRNDNQGAVSSSQTDATSKAEAMHPVLASNVQNVSIVVLRAEDRQFGLVVDEINDPEEIVVKPLSKQLKSINAYAGATIMGDGKVALILDVLGLAQKAGVVREVREHPMANKDATQSPPAAEASQRNAMLLFQYGENGRMAIDLAVVARLEEFSCDLVEVAGDEEVVQYRGQIMPLVRVSEVFESKRQKALGSGQKSLHVIVYSDKGRSVGLVVDRILDIVEESFAIQPQTGRTGIKGSAVIQKRVTDILDIASLLASTQAKVLSAAAGT